jgi:hypothetical protein
MSISREIPATTATTYMQPSDYGLSNWRLKEHDRREIAWILLHYENFEEIKACLYELPRKYCISSLQYFLEKLKEETAESASLAPKGITEREMFEFVNQKCTQFNIQ